jgi:hypothetical protein
MKLTNPRYATLLLLLIVLAIAIPLTFVIRARLEMEDSGCPVNIMNLPATPKQQTVSRLLYASDDGVTTVEIANNHTYTPVLDNPTFVNGTTTAFENQAAWKLTDATGTVIGTGTFYVHSPDAGIPGPFSFQISFDTVPQSTNGTLMVYEASAKDGTPIHAVTIPIIFKNAQ